MKEIRMVDLKSQYQKIKIEIDSAIQEVIDLTTFINGPAVKEFQSSIEKYLNVKNAIPCANGTDALQIALMSLGLNPGDEIITTDFTFISTVEVIELLGLKAVLVDVNPDNFNIDPEAIEKSITSKTRVIIPVHLFGQCAAMEEIDKIALKHNLYIIEDMAQAIGSEYIYKNGQRKNAGSLGNIACTSFFPSKNLGCYGDGGAIFTNDNNLAKKIRSIANHGTKIKYHHEFIGVNSRLDTLQAAILNIKLKYLDEYNTARNNAANYYDKALGNNTKLIIPNRSKYSTHCFHQYTLKCQNINRDELQKFLKNNNIPSMVYYPIPLHSQEAFNKKKNNEKNFSVSNALCGQVISLPMHTELDEEQLNYICQKLIEFVNNN